MDILFRKARLKSAFRSTRKMILEEISEFQPEYLLNVSTEDLVEHLVDKYKGNPPVLHEKKIEICDQGELKEKGFDNMPKRIGVYFVFAIPFSIVRSITFFTFSGCAIARFSRDVPLFVIPASSVPAEMHENST